MRHFILGLFAMLSAGAMARDTPPAGDPAHTVLVMLAAPPAHYRPGAGYGGGYGDMPGRAAALRIARRVASAHHLRLVDDWPMPAIGLDCVVMTIADGRTPDAVAREISTESGVSWAQPLQSYHTQGGGQGDPLLRAEPAEALWHLSALHRLATGRGVSVAVIDSRIDGHHPDLIGRVAVERDFVTGHGDAPEKHGTEVAGIIAGRGGNHIGIVGLAPSARLLGLRACWQTNAAGAAACDSFSLAKALHFAIESGARVINMSLTGPPDRLLDRLVHAGLSGGATIVAAADRARPDGGFPAAIPGVLGVVDQPAPHPGPLYGAPGRDIPTTMPGGGITLAHGSSFAAAHVSGLMALVRSRSSDAHALPLRTRDGGIDACRTVACARPPLATACAVGC